MTHYFSIVKSRVFFYSCCAAFLVAVIYSNYQYVTSQGISAGQKSGKSSEASAAGFQQAAVQNAVTYAPADPITVTQAVEAEPPLTEFGASEGEVDETLDDVELASAETPAEITAIHTSSKLPVEAVLVPTSTPETESREPQSTPVRVVVTPNPINLCGNSFQDAGEECDDGNTNDHDMCLSDCRAARCGDGIVNEIVEQCDDYNMNNSDSCTNQCLYYIPEQ